MALMRPLQELPELETPLNYPECLDRIVQAAENRAIFEIAQDKLGMLIIENIKNKPFSYTEIMVRKFMHSLLVSNITTDY